MKALMLFPTRKKSSRSLWTFWLLFFTFFIAVGATLSVSELLLLSNRKIVYSSVRSTNIEDNREFGIDKEAFVDENNPVVFFAKETVIVGKIKAVTAPDPSGDVLILKRNNWKQLLAKSLKNKKSVFKLFPTSSYGVIYSKKDNGSISYGDLLELNERIRQINRSADPSFALKPVPYLLRLRSGKVEVN